MRNKKLRTSIPDDVAASILVAADRTCCKCRQPGRSLQLHHIDGDPVNHAEENLAVLCLECHNETLVSGGFGRSLTAAQVVRYRDDWHRRVKGRRDVADWLAAEAMANTAAHKPLDLPSVAPELPPPDGLAPFVAALPELRRLAYSTAQPRLDTGNTLEMVDGTWDIIRVLETAWVTLARYYPTDHFGPGDARAYFSGILADRARWHYLVASTGGIGYSGTIVQVLTANAVLGEAERMIEEVVMSLTGASLVGPGDLDYDLEAWLAAWRRERSEILPDDA